MYRSLKKGQVYVSMPESLDMGFTAISTTNSK